MWPQALFTEWHPSLAWNKMVFCFWLFCGTHHCSVWISQQSWWINPHNVPSDVWNYFNSSLKKTVREIMWLFSGHTGSLYQRPEDNLDLFILRGDQASPEPILQKENSEDLCFSSRPAVQLWNQGSPAGMGYHGQGPQPRHTMSLIWPSGESGSKDSSPQDLQSPWRYLDHQHNDGQSMTFCCYSLFTQISPPDLHSPGFLPTRGILYYIFLKSLKQGQWYGCKKSMTDTWTVSVMLKIAIYSCGVVHNYELQLYETLLIHCTCALSA